MSDHFLVAEAALMKPGKMILRLLDNRLSHFSREIANCSLADFEDLKVKWVEKVRPMLTDTKFKPKQNKYCYSCQFRKSNGGSCVVDA